MTRARAAHGRRPGSANKEAIYYHSLHILHSTADMQVQAATGGRV